MADGLERRKLSHVLIAERGEETEAGEEEKGFTSNLRAHTAAITQGPKGPEKVSSFDAYIIHKSLESH